MLCSTRFVLRGLFLQFLCDRYAVVPIVFVPCRLFYGVLCMAFILYMLFVLCCSFVPCRSFYVVCSMCPVRSMLCDVCRLFCVVCLRLESLFGIVILSLVFHSLCLRSSIQGFVVRSEEFNSSICSTFWEVRFKHLSYVLEVQFKTLFWGLRF